jgi:hypothetical protein
MVVTGPQHGSVEEGETIQRIKEDLPNTVGTDGVTIRSENWGGMTASDNCFKIDVDFTPILKGLKDDLWPSRHRGYVLKGALHIRSKDGVEEVIREGKCGLRLPAIRAGLKKTPKYWSSAHTQKWKS